MNAIRNKRDCLGLAAQMARHVELQGHRGARGVLPENSLPGFRHALAAGADCVELDITMSRDGEIVVTHDPALNPDIVRRDGAWINDPISVASLTVADLLAFDVGRLRPGSELAHRFPDQRPINALRLPRLSEVMALPELRNVPGICLDIEIKTSPGNLDATFSPDVIAEALVRTIDQAGMREVCRVRSFDWRGLRHVASIAPDIEIACLTAAQPWLDTIGGSSAGPSPWLAGIDVERCGGSIARAVHQFGAHVAGTRVWAPFHADLTQDELDLAHELGLRVIAWTVNDAHTMRDLLAMGVDGITTDYPGRGRQVIDAFAANQ